MDEGPDGVEVWIDYGTDRESAVCAVVMEAPKTKGPVSVVVHPKTVARWLLIEAMWENYQEELKATVEEAKQDG